MRYWAQGEIQPFILLLSQIDKGRYEGEISSKYGSNVSQSYPNRAMRVRRRISALYLTDQHDMGYFISGEGKEESVDEDDHGHAKSHGFTTEAT